MNEHIKKNVCLKGIFPLSDFFDVNSIIEYHPKLDRKETYKSIPFYPSSISSQLIIYLPNSIRNKYCDLLLKDKLINFVKENMFSIQYDQIYFQLMIYPDNTAMLIAYYNLIIGSRWIAMIDYDSIPEHLKR